MKNLEKEYLISGVGYTLYFKSIRDRNLFKKDVQYIYKKMYNNSKFSNKNALMKAISIAVAKALNIKYEI